jgi:predicted nucleic acid-binding protein
LALLLWDASALAKRYVFEVGSDTVQALFAQALHHEVVGTVLGYAETFSTLLRHYNRGALSASTLADAKTLLRQQVVEDPDFVLLTVDDPAVFAGITLMEQYNVNANDAAILALFLRYVQTHPSGSPSPLLIASDHRLLAAARAEGLATLNPEVLPAADVSAFLAAL